MQILADLDNNYQASNFVNFLMEIQGTLIAKQLDFSDELLKSINMDLFVETISKSEKYTSQSIEMLWNCIQLKNGSVKRDVKKLLGENKSVQSQFYQFIQKKDTKGFIESVIRLNHTYPNDVKDYRFVDYFYEIWSTVDDFVEFIQEKNTLNDKEWNEFKNFCSKIKMNKNEMHPVIYKLEHFNIKKL